MPRIAAVLYGRGGGLLVNGKEPFRARDGGSASVPMLALCAAHDTVAAELRRLAAGEGAIERLIQLRPKESYSYIVLAAICSAVPHCQELLSYTAETHCQRTRPPFQAQRIRTQMQVASLAD